MTETLRPCPTCEIGATEPLPPSVADDGWCSVCGVKALPARRARTTQPRAKKPKAAGVQGISDLLRLRP